VRLSTDLPRLRHVPEERSDEGPARSAERMPVRSATSRLDDPGAVDGHAALGAYPRFTTSHA
jgi:hypothetical protein